MKGIVIVGLGDNFPSVSKDVQQESEDLFMFAKRFQNTGEMNRRGFVGTVIKFQCKWAILTATQFSDLQKVIVARNFQVKFTWKDTEYTKPFYAGNISATPFLVSATGTPKYYRDVSVNIISVGTI